MKYSIKLWRFLDNYIISRLLNRPSTAAFWYLPEPPNMNTMDSLIRYKQSTPSPLFFMDYQQKLKYTLHNQEGIIVLPYEHPIGPQINPEAAFQYALGLHDAYYARKDAMYLKKFWHYADYFLNKQTAEGLWAYTFDWFGSKAPWHSALAQTRGACVMLRAWMLSQKSIYLDAAKVALNKLSVPVEQGGFLYRFIFQKDMHEDGLHSECMYYEEYPNTPTGVINGFMSSLICIWELSFWLSENWIIDLWKNGIKSLEKMLPEYNTGWWSLYDRDKHFFLLNVNSPRYHLLEIHYLQVLRILSGSQIILDELTKRELQYNNFIFKYRALSTKLIRKLLYR
jgi:heparosan-N-sulfate-glucuronate 5-epimerase